MIILLHTWDMSYEHSLANCRYIWPVNVSRMVTAHGSYWCYCDLHDNTYRHRWSLVKPEGRGHETRDHCSSIGLELMLYYSEQVLVPSAVVDEYLKGGRLRVMKWRPYMRRRPRTCLTSAFLRIHDDTTRACSGVNDMHSWSIGGPYDSLTFYLRAYMCNRIHKKIKSMFTHTSPV